MVGKTQVSDAVSKNYHNSAEICERFKQVVYLPDQVAKCECHKMKNSTKEA